jgi:hypothetical protein
VLGPDRPRRIATVVEFDRRALTDFRRSQNDRWHLHEENPRSPQFINAAKESYSLRANATSAMYRVQLVCDSLDLIRLAQDALNATAEVHLAQDEQDRSIRGEKARLALDHFVDGARRHVRGIIET